MSGTIVISLPIADRQRSYDFYRSTLGLEEIGEPAEDGIPEPLQFRLNQQTLLMLVPTGGFGWVLGPREVAAPTVSECILGLPVASRSEVTSIIDRMRDGGGTVVTGPADHDWGFAGVATDPDGHAWQIIVTPPEPDPAPA